MKINRVDRIGLRHIWVPVVMGPLRSVRTQMGYYTREAILGKGLTPTERKYIVKRLDQLDQIIIDLDRIDSRLRLK